MVPHLHLPTPSLHHLLQAHGINSFALLLQYFHTLEQKWPNNSALDATGRRRPRKRWIGRLTVWATELERGFGWKFQSTLAAGDMLAQPGEGQQEFSRWGLLHLLWQLWGEVENSQHASLRAQVPQTVHRQVAHEETNLPELQQKRPLDCQYR